MSRSWKENLEKELEKLKNKRPLAKLQDKPQQICSKEQQQASLKSEPCAEPSTAKREKAAKSDKDFAIPEEINSLSCRKSVFDDDICFEGSPSKDGFLISVFIYRLLWEWSLEGKDQDLLGCTGVSLMTLFTLISEQRLSEAIQRSLWKIFSFLQRREYVSAGDEYWRLSIGNAPWPIGVTMVGIHERKSRQKIQSNQIAHVLNNEETRKWIQCIKRLITQCQKMHPNSDHSKMVRFLGGNGVDRLRFAGSAGLAADTPFNLNFLINFRLISDDPVGCLGCVAQVPLGKLEPPLGCRAA